MNRETQFANILAQVQALAREQGNCVSREQVAQAFVPLSLDEEQLQMVLDYLAEHRIGLGEPVDPDAYLTREERDYLKDYLEEIAELVEFTSGEKEACVISAMAGEASAQSRLTEMYLTNVVDIARLYSGQGVLLEDLIGEGNVALAFGVTMLGSLEKPQEADGMLARLIMDAMEDYIQERADCQKVGKRIADKVNRVHEKAKELSEELQRKVTVEELASETGLSEKSIREALRMSGFQMEYIEQSR